MTKPLNHKKPYSEEEVRRLDEIAASLENKEEMYAHAEEYAKEFGRGVPAICKQIEILKGWHWASRK